MFKIFIVEDDITLRDELSTLLSRYGYECATSDDFVGIVDAVLEAHPHLVLLDLNLPYFDGYHVCREIRRRSPVPIMVVTSRTGDVEELMSMNLGADDFINKPYNAQILLARIVSILRRSYGEATANVVAHKGVELDVAKSIVSFEGARTELTKNELRILYLLMRNKDVIVSRDEIMNELWQSDEFIDDNTLTVNINRLRRKLEEIGVVGFLATKRGQGYLV